MSSTWRQGTASTAGDSPAADPATQQPERFGLAAPLEKVEVTALVCLEHVVEVERPVTAPILRLGGAELLQPAIHIRRGDVEVKPLRAHIEDDRIAVLHRAKRPARRRLRSNVEHDRAES